MNWGSITKIVVMLILTGIVGLVFKIIWDWLASKNGGHGQNKIYERLSKGAEAFATIKEQVKQLENRLNEYNVVRISTLKTEVLLSSLDEKIDKMEDYLEKNFDEAWHRIRELEKQIK